MCKATHEHVWDQGHQLYGVCTRCVDDHLFKQEELETVGEVSKGLLSIVLMLFMWRASADQTFSGP